MNHKIKFSNSIEHSKVHKIGTFLVIIHKPNLKHDICLIKITSFAAFTKSIVCKFNTFLSILFLAASLLRDHVHDHLGEVAVGVGQHGDVLVSVDHQNLHYRVVLQALHFVKY